MTQVLQRPVEVRAESISQACVTAIGVLLAAAGTWKEPGGLLHSRVGEQRQKSGVLASAG